MARPQGPPMSETRALRQPPWLKLVVAGFLALWLVVALFPFVWIGLMSIRNPVDALSSNPLDVLTGATTFEHYRSVWVTHGFWRNFLNSMLVTAGVVTVSLTVGTLAGYGIARAQSSLAFWLLMLALVFRALPHSVLVTGYVPAFLNSR